MDMGHSARRRAVRTITSAHLWARPAGSHRTGSTRATRRATVRDAMREGVERAERSTGMAVSAGEMPTIERTLRSHAVADGHERVGYTAHKRATPSERRERRRSAGRGSQQPASACACRAGRRVRRWRFDARPRPPHAPSVVGRFTCCSCARGPPVRVKKLRAHGNQGGRSSTAHARGATMGTLIRRVARTWRWCAQDMLPIGVVGAAISQSGVGRVDDGP